MNFNIAINGGTPINRDLLPAWPNFDSSVKEDICNIIDSGKVNYWTGDLGKKFEEDLQTYLGEGYVVSTTNGTSALHTAISSLGIGSGDEVICPSYTFIATAFAVMQAGALPVFADVDNTHTLDPSSILKKIGHKTKAIIVVHTFGIPADMDVIMKIAKDHNLLVIEDCAQALGAEYNGKKLGTIGHAGCFSFCQSKHFTTGGEGGAIYVADEALAWTCRSFRDHGYDVEKRIELLKLEEKLSYIHPRIGFNYRMTEIQSAIGIKELQRFDSWNLPNRIRNGKYISDNLKEHPLVIHAPYGSENRVNSYWWAPFVLDTNRIKCDIKTFVAAINAEGVPAYTIPWPEIYLEESFTRRQGFGSRNYPFLDPQHRLIEYGDVFCERASMLGKSTIAFPMHPVYEIRHLDKFLDAFAKVASYFSI
ncbi:MAG: aminotransferase DegT [Cellvibrio sp. 79]|nr:MAG: aminotransferase DegT [Cellvibrio sp. 79]